MINLKKFHDKNLAKKMIKAIEEITPGNRLVNFMEVCGTHTQSFFQYGLKSVLPSNVKLISGPGCPVCVSSQDFIDKAIEYAKKKDIILVTFGDMLRVPGSVSSLEKERGQGADIRVVYSTIEALDITKANPNKKIIFLAVGFETTAPTIAWSILEAKKIGLKNYFVFCSLKLIPPAIKSLILDKDVKIDGFLCPGHVSTIIGAKCYEFIAEIYKIPCVISGFEPLDILEGIYFLLRQFTKNEAKVENQYQRLVKKQGNILAQKLIKKVFKIIDASWRGLGKIPKSGLAIKKEYKSFDIENVLRLPSSKNRISEINKGCICAEVLKGKKNPLVCRFFAKRCNPDNPLGPCMVSAEGTCSVYYRFGQK